MNNMYPIEIDQRTILEQTHDGMNVYDADGERLGHIEHVFLGTDVDTLQDYPADATAVTTISIWGKILDHVLDALFGEDDLPESLRNRLINDGFIQVEGEGLFDSDRYILREQIADIYGNDVHLNVTKDELINR